MRSAVIALSEAIWAKREARSRVATTRACAAATASALAGSAWWSKTKRRSRAQRLVVAVIAPAPPTFRSGSISGSAPASTEKPGKRSISAVMWARSPDESLMPVTMPGKRSRRAAMTPCGIATPDICGMW